MKRFALKAATAVAMLSMLASVPAMANWNQGTGANSGKWWYQNADGSYPSNTWQWIDGNNDGIAECYYFDAQGWMLANTKTPDNYDVNANGQWVVNNSVQTKTSAAAKRNGIVKKYHKVQGSASTSKGIAPIKGEVTDQYNFTAIQNQTDSNAAASQSVDED